MSPWSLAPLALAAAGCVRVTQLARRKGVHRWLGPYLASAHRRLAPPRGRPVHVLLCVADHFEPAWGRPDPADALACVRYWAETFPRQFGGYRDSSGRAPRHTFFYPVEQYRPAELDVLAGLCRTGMGEVEVHLHHDNDTAESLHRLLIDAKQLLAGRHGLLARDRVTGELSYGFVHGNWALCNSRPDGRWCGVDQELTVLSETGCYADFTLPSAPSETQTRKLNSVYWAVDGPGPRGHDRGVDLGTGPQPPGSLLLIQGPLVLDWGRRKWGLLPRLENGCLHADRPPSGRRLDMWLRAGVRVAGRPDWYFVKLHAHGAVEGDMRALLGEPMAAFHRALRDRADRDPNFHYHYVTAREMANLALAAASGWQGAVEDVLDFRHVPLGREWPGPMARPAAAAGCGVA